MRVYLSWHGTHFSLRTKRFRWDFVVGFVRFQSLLDRADIGTRASQSLHASLISANRAKPNGDACYISTTSFSGSSPTRPRWPSRNGPWERGGRAGGDPENEVDISTPISAPVFVSKYRQLVWFATVVCYCPFHNVVFPEGTLRRKLLKSPHFCVIIISCGRDQRTVLAGKVWRVRSPIRATYSSSSTSFSRLLFL